MALSIDMYRERKISLSRVGALIRVLTHLGEDPRTVKMGPPNPKHLPTPMQKIMK